MFRITANALGTPLVDSKGPILLTPGMYSNTADWLKIKDTTKPSTPIQLADMGYDVWLGSTRGRKESNTHAVLNAAVDAAYWEYNFADIGKEDFPAMIDTIIANRNLGTNCNKVTLVTHSSGANSSLVMAATNPAMADKVGRIVNMAPCLSINFNQFWMDQRDISSVNMLY